MQDAPSIRPLPSPLEGVTLHLVAIPEGAVPANAVALLSVDELERAEKFLTDGERCRFVVARAALRRLAGAALEVPPERLAFGSTAQGKLILPQFPHLHFNISHAGACALVGLTRVAPLGVDIEEERTGFDEMGIARARFAPEEVTALARLAQARRRRTFYALWTVKEALAKARGVGIGSLNPMVPPATWPRLMGEATEQVVALPHGRAARLAAPPGYAAAVALSTGTKEKVA